MIYTIIPNNYLACDGSSREILREIIPNNYLDNIFSWSDEATHEERISVIIPMAQRDFRSEARRSHHEPSVLESSLKVL